MNIMLARTVRSLGYTYGVGLGGLGVTCSPQHPRYTGSNPAEVNGLFQDVKIMSKSPLGRTFKLGVPSLRFEVR